VAQQPSFAYGGQAVIEGVMIRGRNHFSLAVRRQDGSITHTHQPLNTLFTGRIRRIPLVRGGAVLIETLMLGVKALHQSANMALLDGKGESEKEMSGWAMGVTLGVSLVLGIGIFFILPLLLVKLIDSSVASDLLSNVVEGLLRLAILVGYIGGIGFIKDIRRVYAYHGAEHMAVHTHEAGLPLNVANVRKFGTPHPRCGTAFLLTVVLVSIVIFAFLGRPDFEWRILSRIALLPVVAGVSYEIIRFSGAHQKWVIARAVAWPGLLLQGLTTRQPDDAQIEVAITAMAVAIAADAGEEHVASFPPREMGGAFANPVESILE
jgi:uncharacterized protein YqhQ